MTPFTIIMPLFRQPNFLHQALTGLKRYSETNPRIIVVWTRPEEFIGFDKKRGAKGSPASDFLINVRGEREQRYSSVQNYMHREAEFLSTLNITFYEADKEGWKLRHELGDKYIDGTDSAYKINIGIEMSDTEFIVPNYDADFFPSPGWDTGILDCVRRNPGPKRTYIATHIQPTYEPSAGKGWENIEDTRKQHCTHLAWRQNNPDYIVNESDWVELVAHLRKKHEIGEYCGARGQTHWNPQIFRLKEFREHIGGFPWGTGTDLHVDDIAGQKGFLKISTYDSFILHKAGIAGLF